MSLLHQSLCIEQFQCQKGLLGFPYTVMRDDTYLLRIGREGRKRMFNSQRNKLILYTQTQGY